MKLEEEIKDNNSKEKALKKIDELRFNIQELENLQKMIKTSINYQIFTS